MKATVIKPVEIEVNSIALQLPVRYDDEDMPYEFPFRDGDMWNAEIMIDSGQIKNWPEGTEFDLYMKVTDSGSYILRDSKGEEVSAIRQDYVPHGVVPGEYGDYVSIKIQGDGVISNWPNYQ